MLKVRGLTISFKIAEGKITPVSDMSFDIARGETIGVVGRSGSGKTVFSTALIGMVEQPGMIESGSISFTGRDGKTLELIDLPENKWRDIRGREISMIFQDSISALNPSRTIKSQMLEAIRLHMSKDRSECVQLSINMLKQVMFDDPERILRAYPFELSGGMCQRVMIAMGLLHNPSLLIADEPTTALDIKTQAEIIDLLIQLREHLNIAIIFISHDMKLVKKISDRVVVMK